MAKGSTVANKVAPNTWLAAFPAVHACNGSWATGRLIVSPHAIRKTFWHSKLHLGCKKHYVTVTHKCVKMWSTEFATMGTHALSAGCGCNLLHGYSMHSVLSADAIFCMATHKTQQETRSSGSKEPEYTHLTTSNSCRVATLLPTAYSIKCTERRVRFPPKR